MRAGPFLLLLMSALTLAQSSGEDFRPDATIVVREHSLGADMVEVTMSRADYPSDLLLRQMEDLGKRVGSAPRGLVVGQVQVDPGNPQLKFVKAKFAIDGLIDRPAGVLRLEPIIRAFAGSPEPYTNWSLLVLFDGERPGAGTIRRHESATVVGEGRVNASPPMIEYAIRLKSQDPAKIDFPEKAPERSAPAKPSEEATGTPVLFWGAVALAGLAAGALVYLALLRGGPGNPKRR